MRCALLVFLAGAAGCDAPAGQRKGEDPRSAAPAVASSAPAADAAAPAACDAACAERWRVLEYDLCAAALRGALLAGSVTNVAFSPRALAETLAEHATAHREVRAWLGSASSGPPPARRQPVARAESDATSVVVTDGEVPRVAARLVPATPLSGYDRPFLGLDGGKGKTTLVYVDSAEPWARVASAIGAFDVFELPLRGGEYTARVVVLPPAAPKKLARVVDRALLERLIDGELAGKQDFAFAEPPRSSSGELGSLLEGALGKAPSALGQARFEHEVALSFTGAGAQTGFLRQRSTSRAGRPRWLLLKKNADSSLVLVSALHRAPSAAH